MTSRALWLRWSWRDLRARWAQVFALALVIALGTGTYAALLSTSAWRTQSNDASFALLHTHDLRVALARGSSVPQGSLLSLVRGLPHAADVAGARERLIVPTQVAGPHGVLAPGELVGTGSGRGPSVDTVHISAGQGMPVTDALDCGQPARGRAGAGIRPAERPARQRDAARGWRRAGPLHRDWPVPGVLHGRRQQRRRDGVPEPEVLRGALHHAEHRPAAGRRRRVASTTSCSP